jgi:sterol desaturase/sphingolipid hydroxylase (fatty acid hydroxylase superfamily)
MFNTAVHWYAAHAAILLTVLVVSMIVMEQIRRRADGADHEHESTVTSITSGLAFLAVKMIVSKLAFATLALVVYDRFRVFDLDLANPLVWIGVFVLRDLIYYWVHRAEHRIRLLWASHMVHHSPESIGFTTAVRVPWMEAIYKPWVGLWVPLIGFNPVAFIALDVLAATIGQLYHTESVRRLPVVEQLFVTPSAHRVHHGSNPDYIDKNFGAVLIVWDKLFGTFEREVAPVVYGIGAKQRIDTPVKALVGGFPALVDDLHAIPSKRARVCFAFTPPT